MRFSLIMAAGAWLGLVLSGSASAQEEGPCAEAKTTIEIGDCVAKAYKSADEELNAVWKQIMEQLKTNDYLPANELRVWRSALLAAQRAWVEFKVKDCEAVSFEWYGGSGASNAAMFCLLEHTTARTKDLKARYLDR